MPWYLDQISNCMENETSITIPYKIDEYEIDAIDKNAFEYEKSQN